MTEAEWLACDNPLKMFRVDGVRLDLGKVWRFWIEGARLLCADLGSDCSGLELEERTLERGDFSRFCHPDTLGIPAVDPGLFGINFVFSLDLDRRKQAEVLRDIFGNPFRPVNLDRAWLTTDVVALARGIYDERAFDRMPILADALQDAGCDNEEVLSHCRDEKATHVRGCWVVDLLLGKS